MSIPAFSHNILKIKSFLSPRLAPTFCLWAICGLLCTCGNEAKAATAEQIIKSSRAATTVSAVRIYNDSTFTRPSENQLAEGELLEIVAESVREHDDNAQNQTFKWYRIKTMRGLQGWVFGDNIAVVMPEQYVEQNLRSFYKKTFRFDNGFQDAIAWVAAVNGRDNLHRVSDFLNPPYKEFYLVLTNAVGKCVQINYGGANESGRKELQNIFLQDLTTNGIDEVIVETATFANGSNVEQRNVEIYSFQTGGLQKIFEERTTLLYDSEQPSPALFKMIEIENNTIRVSYIDYVALDKYTLRLPTDPRTRTQERALEYVTTTYIWDAPTRQLRPLYAQTRSIPTAQTTEPTLLRRDPNTIALAVTETLPNERLQVIKHYESYQVAPDGHKYLEHWLYVRHLSGTYGYVLATAVRFKKIEHAVLLEQYYQTAPLQKTDWKAPAQYTFLRLRK